MNNLLNDKEYKTLKEVHKEFDKTCFGKRVNRIILVFPIFFCVSLFMGIICSSLEFNNCDVYGAICFSVSFINLSFAIMSALLYENMAMNYIREIKK